MTCTAESPARRSPAAANRSRGAARWSLLFALLGVHAGCGNPQPPATATPAAPAEVVVLGYAEDMPRATLDTFSKEHGIVVRYVGYQSPQDVVEQIRTGGEYDLAMVENQLVPALAAAGLLAEIDWASIPNFKNVSAAFRDLAVDPGNRHSAPNSYGTAALLVRTDLTGDEVQRWSDLWDPRYAGKIGLRAAPREVIGLTLASLGHAFNSEDPQALAAALERLLQLRGAVTILDVAADEAVPRLLSGDIAILHGYAEDHGIAHPANPAVAYVLPREGAVMWGDSWVIPAASGRKHAAEALLDYLLRGDAAARYVNEKRHAVANDAALAFIEPEIRGDPVIFPPAAHLRGAHHILPLSPEGEARYAEVWARFVAGRSEGAP